MAQHYHGIVLLTRVFYGCAGYPELKIIIKPLGLSFMFVVGLVGWFS